MNDIKVNIPLETFKRLLSNTLHQELIIVNKGTEEHPDYTISGEDLVVKAMCNFLYEDK